MKNLYIIAVLAVASIFTACSEPSPTTAENKETYEVAVGETFEIYYSTNSCCFYCIYNQSSLQHVEKIDDLTVDSGPDDCDGCNSVSKYVFKATSVGEETIELKNVVASSSCEEYEGEVDSFKVIVK